MFSLKLFGVKFDDAGRPPNRYEANLDPLIQFNAPATLRSIASE